MTRGWRCRCAVLALLSVIALAGCDPLSDPDLSPKDVDADDAAQALSLRHIDLPDGYTFREGRMIPVAFAGRPGYDLAYDAPVEVFEDPKPLEAAYTGAAADGAFPAFRQIDCHAGVLSIARERKWVTCTPTTRAKLSVTGQNPSDTRRPFYDDGIVLVTAEGKTVVIVVIGGS